MSNMQPLQTERQFSWAKTRESYIDWVAAWGSSSTIKQNLLWRGFSLWWCCNLVQKDAEVNKSWYEDLHHRLNGLPQLSGPKDRRFNKTAQFIKQFLVDALKLLLVKTLARHNKIPSEKVVWFHSLQSNIKIEDGVACDRMFSKAHLLDKEYGAKSAYAITLIPGFKDLKNPFAFKRELEKLLSQVQRDSIILNSFVRFGDLINVHFSLYLMWRRFGRLSRREEFRNGFAIEGIRFDDILIDELENSFFGAFQWSLLTALSFQRWLEKSGASQLIITYAETVALLRPTYFFSKKVNAKNQFISIQHTNFIKNKLFLYHRKSEFSCDGKWDGVRYSPMPDYYLIQGEHFSRALEQYYPANSTKIVGCLKYDNFRAVLNDRKMYEMECRSKLAGKASKILLIAPSVNDLQDILKIFVDAQLPAGWRVIISTHPFISLDRYRGLVNEMKISMPLEFSPGLPTYKLLTIADLVVCGYSAVAFEAAIFGVRSVRIFNESICPQFDEEPEIPSFSNKEAFWRWFNDNDQSPKTQQLIGSETDRLVTDYFYKIDGKSANRLWESIMPIAQVVS